MFHPESTPERSSLIEQVESANRLAVPWIVAQVAASAALAYALDWDRIFSTPLVSTVAVLAVVGPFVMEIFYQFAARRKNIDDLKESTRYGEFDKHRLRGVVNDTLMRLGLSPPGPPVYVTPDKSLNAGALHLGLGGFLRSLNGVYLNRQVLHRLTPDEVRYIVGHELGHFYRYYLLSDRFRFVTLIFGGLCGLFIYQWLGLSDIFGFVALSICGSAGWYVSGKLRANCGEAIEYLCDDYGARAAGVVVSINALLKVGADAELQEAIHHQELLAPRHGNLNARDVVEAISEAVPYGHTSPEDLQKAVEESLARRSKKRESLSLAGFLEYAWQGDGFDGAEEAMEVVKAMRKVPRLEWESLLDRPGRIQLGETEIEELADLLEADPDRFLFRLSSEIGDENDIHPPFRDRILYLWKNRAEIESTSRRRLVR